MRRYWLAFAMVLLPCLALGGWACWEYASRWRQDEVAMREGWRTLAEAAARAELRERLDRLRALGDAFPSTGDAAALAAFHANARTVSDLVFAVDMDGVRSSFPRPAAEIPAAADPRLIEARRAEFVDSDSSAAERAYRAILADPSVAVRREAEAGLVAVLLARGDAVAAAGELRSALARSDGIGVADGAALALELHRGDAPAAADAAILLLAYARLLGRPEEGALQGRLEQALAEREGALDAAGRARRAALRELVEHDRRAREAFSAFTPADRRWLMVRIEGDAREARFHRLATGEIFSAGMLREGVGVVARFDERSTATGIGESLRRQAGLAALAEAYTRRYGKPIADGGSVITVEAPWGSVLRVEAVADQVPGGAALLAHLPALAFVACALALAIAGFIFLYRTARRDLRLAQLKSDFVSNVSHEMKTPLSLVRMFGEMLSLGYERDEAERRRYHEVIVQESQRLGMLVNNVLDFAAIEKGRKRFASAPLDLAALAREVLDAYRVQLEADGFALELALEQPGPTVAGDRDALTQVLLNLLSNAMKYSREARWVSVSALHQDGEAVLAVADRGIGIDPAEHGRIFEQFYRVESGLTRETRGAGLGLSLVRSIVSAHGGRVEVDSALGRGSVFRVRLPLAGAPAT